MPQKMEGYHHFHKRKRIYQKLEPYPHPNKWKRTLDKLIFFVAVAGVIMTIPQVLEVWVGKNAAGVSEISWATYAVTSFFWLLYGIAHKDKPIIISNVSWIILSVAIVAGALIY